MSLHQFPSFATKRAHEREIAEKLTNLLYPKFVFERFGNDTTEPDVILTNQSDKLGIEVTTAYYEDMKQQDIADIKIRDQAMCQVVDHMVIKKSTRHYNGVDKVILCIEVLDPDTIEYPIINCLLNLAIPKQHPFVEIYVLSYTVVGGEYEVFKIFPADK